MSATTNHRSEGAESVFGEASPMLKSSSAREQNMCYESKGAMAVGGEYLGEYSLVPGISGILLKFYRVPISTYTLMWLLQIKKLGPGKFYMSTKKELGFIGGNPGSHKGWMSRYFFIKRISSRENPWGCDMSWRDDAHTLPPPTPEQKPDMTQFLYIVSGKCFDAQKLIEEDLLCHFRFSGKNVQLVGDLGDKMTKAEMMKALKERKANSEEASSSRAPSKEKRKTSSEGRERLDTAQAVPEQQSTEAPYVLLDTSTISFMAKPSGSVSLDFIRRLVPDQDFDLALVRIEEATNRLSQARNEVVRTKRSMDGVLGHHDDLLKQLEEMWAQGDRKRSRCDSSWRPPELMPNHRRRWLKLWKLKSSVRRRRTRPSRLKANEYSEEEHPTTFIDVEQALTDMPEESEENISGSEEAPPS
ncbi:hypothetical protein F511_40656 [Dorcoceras hygrometricum]|uniref:Uncharacterized protein n=1 Tax=Dorcoceras hygrometricum TaxID=472368 RepID=A0A2Z7D9Z4_9LAMI|nr:hypothetical protein F511_40656 [Dorcoceras hygrometricum]